MSKKRSLRNRSNPSFFNATIDDRKFRNSSIFGAQTIKSKYIPDSNRNTTSNIEANMSDYHKQKKFNKNICHFRQSFNQNDPSQLPFMSSLRMSGKYKSCDISKSTICQPFEAGQKTTSNMKFRKVITDMYGKGTRMSGIYYRWHNKSGTGIKQEANFECTLRDYNKSWAPNPQQSKYNNIIKPIKYKDIEPQTYEQSQLICPRQRRLFKMK